MKAVKITASIIILGLVAIFWSDISKAATSISGSAKNPKSEKSKDGETTDPSSNITIKNKWQLPAVLMEISGLSYLDADRFACVQDELGKIFIYNTKTSSLEKEISFGAAGDYEGITVVGKDAWVLRADGRLFEVANFEAKPVVKEFGTHLTAKQNAEGLCYDKEGNRLLVAIKDEEPGNPGYKGVYGFDLAAKKMDKAPVIKIDTDNNLLRGKGSKKKDSGVKPSAIAIHPATGKIYITDGPKAKLLVMTNTGEVEEIYQLDGKYFTQPEGITFNPAGELFISNEGSKGPGNIINLEISK